MLICILNMYGIYITVTSWSPNLWRISPQVFTQQIEKHFSLVPITTSRNNNNMNYYNFEIQPDNTDKSCVRSWEGIDLHILGKLTGGSPGAGKTPTPTPRACIVWRGTPPFCNGVLFLPPILPIYLSLGLALGMHLTHSAIGSVKGLQTIIDTG